MHFDLAMLIILQSDANSFSLAGILNKYNSFGILKPVNFFSEKYSLTVQNYEMLNQEQ